MRGMRFRAVLARAWVMLASCAPEHHLVTRDPAATRTFCLRNVRVFDARRATLRDGLRDVLVREGTITAIAPAGMQVSGALEIDGMGAALPPGLVDLHVHLGGDLAAGDSTPEAHSRGVPLCGRDGRPRSRQLDAGRIPPARGDPSRRRTRPAIVCRRSDVHGAERSPGRSVAAGAALVAALVRRPAGKRCALLPTRMRIFSPARRRTSARSPSGSDPIYCWWMAIP